MDISTIILSILFGTFIGKVISRFLYKKINKAEYDEDIAKLIEQYEKLLKVVEPLENSPHFKQNLTPLQQIKLYGNFNLLSESRLNALKAKIDLIYKEYLVFKNIFPNGINICDYCEYKDNNILFCVDCKDRPENISSRFRNKPEKYKPKEKKENGI
jgi:hypothetical protein